MPVTTPEWLSKRDGTLDRSADKTAWCVTFNQQIQYELAAVPVAGKFASVITQAANGKRIPSSAVFATADEAISGGLDDLRKHIGW